MKKTLLAGICGLAACAATSYGQGFIALDNYSSSAHPLVTYGSGVFANGISGALGQVGTGVTGSGWTVGLYFALGNVTASSDQTAGNGIPLALALGTGGTAGGATTTFLSGSLNGEFAASAYFQATAATPGASGTTVTLEVVAYNGTDYASATQRGHSAAFIIPALAGTSFPNNVGDYMSTFSVTPVPEPTTLALAGLGGFGMLMALRRKQA